MSLFALWFVYGLVGLLSIRPVAGHFAWMMHRNDRYPRGDGPNGDKWLGAYVSAVCLAFVWPAVVAVVAVGAFGPKIGAERAHVVQRQKRRIEDLERELGIGDDA